MEEENNLKYRLDSLRKLERKLSFAWPFYAFLDSITASIFSKNYFEIKSNKIESLIQKIGDYKRDIEIKLTI